MEFVFGKTCFPILLLASLPSLVIVFGTLSNRVLKKDGCEDLLFLVQDALAYCQYLSLN